MSETNNKSGLYIGPNHGMNKQLPAKQAWKTRPVTRKGKATKRAAAVREVIREVAGISPLEKRMLELIMTGVATREKEAAKMARAKIGTHRRAMLKKEFLVDLIAAEKRRGGK